MEIFIFTRFHALPGAESVVAEALHDVVAPTSEEAVALAFVRSAQSAIRSSSIFTRVGKMRRLSRHMPACRIPCDSSSALSRFSITRSKHTGAKSWSDAQHYAREL